MYFLWLNNTQAGPFTLTQLAEQWQTGRVNDLTLYWEEGNASWLPLHNIAATLDVAPLPERPSSPTPTAIPTLPVIPSGAPELTVADGQPRSSEVVAWSGHPSLWDWVGSIIWGIILTPILVGIFILFYVFWKRSRTRYRITNRRVSVEAGVFTRTSRELRIEDIRSIAAQANIFGIGDIAFSTAARAEAEVVFHGLSNVEKVREIVKQLQNEIR